MIGAAEPARDRDVRHDEIEVPELVQPACEETVDVLLARSQETAWSSARSVKLERTQEDGKRRCQACSAEIRSGRAPLRSARARNTPLRAAASMPSIMAAFIVRSHEDRGRALEAEGPQASPSI